MGDEPNRKNPLHGLRAGEHLLDNGILNPHLSEADRLLESPHKGTRHHEVSAVDQGDELDALSVFEIAPHVPGEWSEKKRFQFDSLMQAEGFWAGVQAVSGQDPGYARLGRLQPVADERAAALAEKRGAAARACCSRTSSAARS